MIKMADPQISQEDIDSIIKVLKSGQLSAGPVVRQFESTFAEKVGARFGVATNSGTSALQAILRALDLRPGDQVITTPLSFVATANAIIDSGAVPIFVDIDPHTYNLSPLAVEKALRKHSRVRAILAVHLYGLPFDLALLSIAKAYGVYLLEDAAQAHGACINDRPVGSLGYAAAFSFYPTKNMTTTEGGMVTTSDEKFREKAKLIINQGQKARYEYTCLGFNYRMTDLQAAMGLVQLRALPMRNKRRREIAHYYNQTLTEDLTRPVEPPGYRHVYHQYTLRSPYRTKIKQALELAGIDSNIYYPRLITQEPYLASYPFIAEPCPVAEQIVQEVLSIPVHPALTETQIDLIAHVINMEWESIKRGK